MVSSSGEGGTDGKDLTVCTCTCGSAHDCGCMINGSNIKCYGNFMSIIIINIAKLIAKTYGWRRCRYI